MYPFVSQYKSEWIPGFIVEDRINGTSKIHFESEEDLQVFENAVLEAGKDHADSVSYNNCEVAIEDAEKIIAAAHRQFDDQSNPIKDEAKVLIIKENAELLDYEEDSSIKELEHRFEPISGLKEDISLHRHQREGIAWLQSLYNENSPGCLLADDMGMGKTLQVLYFFEWLSGKQESAKVLVVAPVSLLENWEREYNDIFPRGTYSVVQARKSPEVFAHILDGEKATHKPLLVLTNYESLRRHQLTACAINWSACSLDEAQRIKTPGTIVTNAAKALKSSFKIAMTGTPVENSFHDLWCIMDYCVPGLLGSAKNFSSNFTTRKNDSPEKIRDKGIKLRRECGIYLKRRLKSELKDELPQKFSSANPEHASHFADLHLVESMPELQLIEYRKELSAHIDTDKKHKAILETIRRLKWISDHPFLYQQDLLEWKYSKMTNCSARIIALLPALKRIKRRKEKALIFAEFKKTQLLLRHIVRIEFGIEARIINGDTPALSSSRERVKQSRQRIVEDFNGSSGFNILVMSPVAAGVGLNITGANHVIHFGRHWNPAKENQATDRAYRIGQKKDVYLYHPKAVSDSFKTFDEVLSDLLDRKRTLAKSTLFPSEMVEVRISDVTSALGIK